MIYLRLYIILAILFSVVSLQATEKSVYVLACQQVSGSDFEFKEQIHDFGKVKKKQQHTFVVTNTGDAPLVLKYIATGCGCTTTEYTKEPIPPGKTGKIVVSFDPTNQRAGAFRKSITIYTNSPKDYTRLFIKGEVVK